MKQWGGELCKGIWPDHRTDSLQSFEALGAWSCHCESLVVQEPIESRPVPRRIQSVIEPHYLISSETRLLTTLYSSFECSSHLSSDSGLDLVFQFLSWTCAFHQGHECVDALSFHLQAPFWCIHNHNHALVTAWAFFNAYMMINLDPHILKVT